MVDLAGTAGDDVLTGGDGDDAIDGGAGHDRLSGGGGADILRGGPGDDEIAGGAGADVFIFRPGDGDDVLTDFNPAEGDILILEGGWFFASVGSRFDEITLDINNGQGSVTIRNVNLQQAAGSIRFAPAPAETTLEGGDRSNDRIVGSAAGDRLVGGGGYDILDGGAGDDTLEGGLWDDTLSGGDGLDWLSGGSGGDLFVFHPTDDGAVIMDFNAAEGDRIWLQGVLSWSVSQEDVTGHILVSWSGTDGVEGFAQVVDATRAEVLEALTVVPFEFVTETLTGDRVGTRFNDSMPGAEGPDAIDGLAGNDIIDGLGGDDRVQGGAGDDRLLGGAGDDHIQGGLGTDTLSGNAGADVFYLRPDGGTDTVTDFSYTDDRIDVGQRRVTQIFQQGADTVVEIEGGARLVLANFHADLLSMQHFTQTRELPPFATVPGPLTLIGTSGADVLVGEWTDDELRGMGGDDDLSGNNGADLLLGGDGNDLIRADGGNDTIDGGAGIDTYVLAGSARGTVDLVAGTAQSDIHGFDRITGIEIVRGAGGDDAITGGLDDNRLYGGGGADLIRGIGGDDRLYGEAGDDDILADISGNDLAWGGTGNDSILAYRWLDHAADTIVLHGEAGNDDLRFTADDRGIDIVSLFGGADADRLEVAGAATAIMDGGDGDDRIAVFEGYGAYDVRLGAGRDLLEFRAFNWNGTHAYGTGGASIVVQDFAVGDGGDEVDLLSLAGRTVTGLVEGENYFTTGHFRLVQVGDDTRLEMDRDGGGDAYEHLVLFRNTTVSSFTAANFGGHNPAGGGVVGETFIGTAGSDNLSGTFGDDILRGLDGGDGLSGSSGNDLLEGGAGVDFLTGGDGSDRLEGGTEADTLRDSGGDDALFGGDGDDVLLVRPDGLGPFPPPLPGETPTGPEPREGYDVRMDGGAGDDDIQFYATNRWIDTVTAIGGDGADFIGVDFARLAVCSGGFGEDTFRVTIGGGDYRISTGADSDLVVVAFAASMVGADGPFSLRISDFTGGAGGDRIDVSDVVWDRSGGDYVADPFAEGWLRIMQTAGNSYLQVREAVGAGFVNVATLSNTEAWTLTSANFTDFLGAYDPGALLIVGRAEAEQLKGGRAADEITGAGGADVIDGGDGDDRIDAGTGDDVVVGGLGKDRLLGGDGSDRLDGGSGRDQLHGGAGDDVIAGGSGDDLIDGGDGSDVLTVSGARSDYRLLEIDGGFLLKGLEGRDTLTGVEEIRFADGSRIELLRIDGEDRLLETLPAAPGDKAFDPDAWVTPPADDVVPGKDLFAGEEPEIMPGLDDGLPLLLPAGTGVWRADSRLWLDEGLVDRPTAWDDILA